MGNIITYKNSINNYDSNKNSSNNSNGVNESFNESYNRKMIPTQNKLGTIVNHEVIKSYISGLRPGDQVVPTSFHMKE